MSSKTVFLAEDDPVNSKMLRYYLEENSFEVIHAEDGQQAWELLSESEKTPDTIVLDWMMPGIEGVSLLEKIKQIPRLQNIPVIMQTAKADSKYVVEGLSCGASHYLPKPFSGDVFIATVNSALNEYERFQKLIEAIEIQGEALNVLSELSPEANQSLEKVLHSFLVKSSKCTTTQSLAQLLLDCSKEFQYDSSITEHEPSENKKLRCSLRITHPAECDISDREMLTSLDTKILQRCIDKHKLLRSGNYAVMPSQSGWSALMIRNAPTDDAEYRCAISNMSVLLELFERCVCHLQYSKAFG